MKRLVLFVAFVLSFNNLFADNCFGYKSKPVVEITNPNPIITITQPDKPLNLLHGDVAATFEEKYEVTFSAQKTQDGFCISVDSVNANIGYSEFDIQIDKRHVKGSCEFLATKAHEEEHIKAHLSTLIDNEDNIKNVITDVANNILPVFVDKEENIDKTMEKINGDFETNPQIKLLRQKLDAEQEIRNKKVDLNDKGERIRECMNKSNDGILDKD